MTDEAILALLDNPSEFTTQDIRNALTPFFSADLNRKQRHNISSKIAKRIGKRNNGHQKRPWLLREHSSDSRVTNPSIVQPPSFHPSVEIETPDVQCLGEPQPDDAVGMPPEVERVELERREKLKREAEAEAKH